MKKVCMKMIRLVAVVSVCLVQAHAFCCGNLSNSSFVKRLVQMTLRQATTDDDTLMARRIMFNQQSRIRESMHYQIIAAEAAEPLARRMQETFPDRFHFHETKWGKFPDGTDNIEIGGFYPENVLSGQHILFLASFHNNDVSLSQFQVIIALLQSFIESVTIVLP